MSTQEKPKYDRAEDFIWDTYLKASKDEDAARPKNWEGSTTGILTFVRTSHYHAKTACRLTVRHRLVYSPRP